MPAKEFTDKIKRYLENKNIPGAALITGAWGKGKTYFINNALQFELNSFAFVVVSLFGIDSVEQLHKSIKVKYLDLSKIGKFKNAVNDRNAKKAMRNAGKNIPIIGSFTEFLDIDISDFVTLKPIKRKPVILVFDDFERCTINTDVLLGVINDYCENKKIKTIIVVNEDEIERKDIYQRFKEKVVFRTFPLVIDPYTIIKNILESYQCNDAFKNVLTDNIDLIIQIWMQYSDENIRSLKSALVDFDYIYSLLCANITPSDYADLDIFVKEILGFVVKFRCYTNSSGYISSEEINGMTDSKYASDNMVLKYTKTLNEDTKRKLEKAQAFDSYRYNFEEIFNLIEKSECDDEKLVQQLIIVSDAYKTANDLDKLRRADRPYKITDELLQKEWSNWVDLLYSGKADFNEICKCINWEEFYKKEKITLPSYIDDDKLKQAIANPKLSDSPYTYVSYYDPHHMEDNSERIKTLLSHVKECNKESDLQNRLNKAIDDVYKSDYINGVTGNGFFSVFCDIDRNYHDEPYSEDYMDMLMVKIMEEYLRSYNEEYTQGRNIIYLLCEKAPNFNESDNSKHDYYRNRNAFLEKLKSKIEEQLTGTPSVLNVSHKIFGIEPIEKLIAETPQKEKNMVVMN